MSRGNLAFRKEDLTASFELVQSSLKYADRKCQLGQNCSRLCCRYLGCFLVLGHSAPRRNILREVGGEASIYESSVRAFLTIHIIS